MSRYIVGVDVGGTYIRIGLVDERARVREFHRLATGEIGADSDFMQALLGQLEAYIRRVGTLYGTPVGLSIGFPSTIDKDRQTLLSTPNIPGMDQVPAVELLSGLGLPVVIDKDVNMLLVQDMHHFSIPSESLVLGFYIGTGFGNAVFVHGQLLHGANGAAGELGHVPMMGRQELCTCGNPGCAENYASGKRLQQLQQTLFPQTPLHRVFAEHRDHEALLLFIEHVSLPIAAEVNIFDPDYIVLGGGILDMEGFPVTLLEQHIYSHVRKPYPACGLRICYSSDRPDSGVLGAGLAGFRLLGGR